MLHLAAFLFIALVSCKVILFIIAIALGLFDGFDNNNDDDEIDFRQNWS